ncbi:MAG TPA: hypothetical protein VFO85_08915 [Vicinamibacteria bacterium]|nr:hypothetical protein [Vicinamibacteria bacterium]
MRHEVSTQAAFDALLSAGVKPGDTIVLIGSDLITIDGRARAEGAHVEAWKGAHVVARGSAHVVAWESAHVEARESAHVVAGGFVAITKHPGHTSQISGGVVIVVARPTTAAEWCEFYGVAVVDDVATLYKALGEDFTSPRGLSYAPGTQPEAADWDGGHAECGGGLHFSPRPQMALRFHDEARRFVACRVALADMRPPQEGDRYPEKVKARRVCGPVVEVDRYGTPVDHAGDERAQAAKAEGRS